MIKKVISPVLLCIIIIVSTIMIANGKITLNFPQVWIGFVLGATFVAFVRLTISLIKQQRIPNKHKEDEGDE